MSRDARAGEPTPAQQRLLEEVLGWGRPRPQVPEALLDELRARIRDGVQRRRHAPTACTRHLGAVLRAEHAPAPLRHDRDTVRGILLGRAFARDVEAGHTAVPAAVVEEVVTELAGERPGDPSSASAWVNGAGATAMAGLRRELTGVLEDVRTLWPALDRAPLTVQVRPTLRVEVAPGPTVVTVRPDLLLDSRRQDDRARSLVVVTRTGMPRPREDLERTRATALLAALATGRVPFRWVTLHLTDGRAESEDLDHDVLLDTATLLAGRVAALCGEDPRSDPGDRQEGA